MNIAKHFSVFFYFCRSMWKRDESTLIEIQLVENNLEFGIVLYIHRRLVIYTTSNKDL